MINLVITKPDFNRHAHEAGNADPRTITHARGAHTELPVFMRDRFEDAGERMYIHAAAQQTLPEDNEEDDVDVGYEVEERVQGQEHEVPDLQKGLYVQTP